MLSQKERFSILYASSKRSTRRIIQVGLVIILSGMLFWWNDHPRLAEFSWFLVLFPTSALIKIGYWTRTLLTFNVNGAYQRYVWMEFGIVIGIVMLFLFVNVTILYTNVYLPSLFSAYLLILGGIVGSSYVERRLTQIDIHHVPYRLYRRAKAGHTHELN